MNVSRVCVSVVDVLHSDKLFPAFGFGAKIPPEGKVIVV